MEEVSSTTIKFEIDDRACLYQKEDSFATIAPIE